MPATPTRDRVSAQTESRPLRRPDWIKVRAPSGETFEKLQVLMRSKELHTVCEEADVPEPRRMLGQWNRDLPDAR